MSYSYDVRKSKYLKKMISSELSVARYLIKIHFAGNYSFENTLLILLYMFCREPNLWYSRKMRKKEQIYVTFENKRKKPWKKLSSELLIVRNSLENQTAGNFVSFIFYLNVNFRTMNFWDISKRPILSTIST